MSRNEKNPAYAQGILSPRPCCTFRKKTGSEPTVPHEGDAVCSLPKATSVNERPVRSQGPRQLSRLVRRTQPRSSLLRQQRDQDFVDGTAEKLTEGGSRCDTLIARGESSTRPELPCLPWKRRLRIRKQVLILCCLCASAARRLDRKDRDFRHFGKHGRVARMQMRAAMPALVSPLDFT